MKVGFADSFWDSLQRMARHQTWWYKTYELFRYDISRFIRNVWRFRKPLSNHYWWDHHSMLQFMETALVHMSDNLETRGNEVDGPRMKKVLAMRRAVELIKNYNEDNYIEIAEKELGEIIHHPWEFEPVEDKPGYSRLVVKETEDEKVHNRKVFDRAREIGEQEWNELFTILKGQDQDEYHKLYDNQTEEEKKERELWNEWFDGSGIRGWWD